MARRKAQPQTQQIPHREIKGMAGGGASALWKRGPPRNETQRRKRTEAGGFALCARRIERRRLAHTPMALFVLQSDEMGRPVFHPSTPAPPCGVMAKRERRKEDPCDDHGPITIPGTIRSAQRS